MKHRAHLAALAILLTPAAAVAQVQTYYHSGAWDAFSGRNDKGGAVCGIGSTMSPDNRRLSLGFDIGGSDTNFSVSKPDWSIPDNTRITVVMQIGLNTPWTEQGIGHGHTIDWTMDPDTIQTFDQQFRGAASMTLTFPNGNEPPWSVPLTGSTMISDTFGRCVQDLTRQVQAAQPTTDKATSQRATQPFSAGSAGLPPNGPAPNGPAPSGPEPADPGQGMQGPGGPPAR